MEDTILNKELVDANLKLFSRYLDIIESEEIILINKIDKKYLIDFCNIAIKTPMQIDKHSRWLGFLQGVLFSLGIISIDEERDVSRVLFQEIYKKYNIVQNVVSVN